MSIIDEYYSKDGNIINPYTCILNQTDIDANKNKFYIMQLILNKTEYCSHIRYGRIGEKGTIVGDIYTDKDSAVAFFTKQFKSKTGNNFGSPFIKKQGKYFLSTLETPVLEKTNTDEVVTQVDQATNPDDNLDDRIKYFLDLISNEKMLAETLVKLNIDPKKMPLGKISNKQLEQAVELLKKIKELVDPVQTTSNNQQLDPATTPIIAISKSSLDEIKQISCDYYTLVPYSCGRKKPPSLETSNIVDDNMALIDELKNIHVTYSIIKNLTSNIGRLSNVYNQLNSNINSLDKSSIMYSELLKYVANTQAHSHNRKLKVLDIFEVNKNANLEYDKNMTHMKNKMLLFHGSPISNWCSIIKNGLLLDPSKLGVKITGKMFGYGIYWANSVSKSFNYCSSESTNNVAVLAIGEVALGDMFEQYHGNNISQTYLDKIKKNSTWGKGGSSPEYITTVDGVSIPNGKIKKNDTKQNYSLYYDEFIIYNADQYKMRYVIVLQDEKN